MPNSNNAPKKFTVEQERIKILERYPKASFEELSVMLDRQFQLLQARGYALLFVCGFLVTGNAVIGSLFPSAKLISPVILAFRLGGGAFAVGAAAIVMMGVMRLRWITQYPGETIESWLEYALALRNRKTIAFKVSTFFALLSILLYECSVIAYLVGYMKAE